MLRSLLDLSKESRWLLIASVGSGMVSGVLIALLIAMINRQIAAGDIALPNFLVVVVSSAVFGAVTEHLMVRFSQVTTQELRMRLCGEILGMPLIEAERLGTHRLLAVLADDVEALIQALICVPYVIVNVTIIFACLFYLALLWPAALLKVLVFMVVGVAAHQLIMSSAMRYLRAARNSADRLFSHFRAVTSGLKELKINDVRRRRFLHDDLEKTVRKLGKDNISGYTRIAIASQWGNLMFFTATGLLLFQTTGHPSGTANPIAVSAVIVVLYLMGPISIVLTAVPAFGKAAVAWQKIQSYRMNMRSENTDAPVANSAEQTAVSAEIELRNIFFSYKDEDGTSFAVSNISLRLTPGRCVFLVGGNGSGKSTLLKLITGLYVPDQGGIYVAGQVVYTHAQRQAYSRLFASIFGDYYLFDNPIVHPVYSKADIDDYLRILKLDDKTHMVDGVFTNTALSQGQRKRLALAMAYWENKAVYVFDEWASDQDPVFRDFFYREVIKDLKRSGKAVLVVSHDEAYYSVADEIIKLDAGRIVEIGGSVDSERSTPPLREPSAIDL